MSKVDWSLAPSDAQIYSPEFGDCNAVWYKVHGGKVFCWPIGSHGWSERHEMIGELIYRPKQEPKPWSGPEDGLPPVNTECEVETDYGVWEFCTVLAHGYDDFKPHAVAQCASGLWMEEVAGFRAIRTPEQLAAEQRETAIADMAKVLPGAKNECYTFNDDGSVRPYAHIHDVLGLLVDAGFKREVV